MSPETSGRVLHDLSIDTSVPLTLTEMRIKTENVRRHTALGENCIFARDIATVSNGTITATWEARTQPAERLALRVDDPEKDIIFTGIGSSTSPIELTLTDLAPDPSSGLVRLYVFVNETAAIAEQLVDLQIELEYRAERELVLTTGRCSEV